MESNIFYGKTPDEAKKLYREKVKSVHPDKGGTSADFIPIQKMYDEYKETLTDEQVNYLDDLFKDDAELASYLNAIILKLPKELRDANEFKQVLNLIHAKITPETQNLISSAFQFIRKL